MILDGEQLLAELEKVDFVLLSLLSPKIKSKTVFVMARIFVTSSPVSL
jgi:hypothetical protein